MAIVLVPIQWKLLDCSFLWLQWNECNWWKHRRSMYICFGVHFFGQFEKETVPCSVTTYSGFGGLCRDGRVRVTIPSACLEIENLSSSSHISAGNDENCSVVQSRTVILDTARCFSRFFFELQYIPTTIPYNSRVLWERGLFVIQAYVLTNVNAVLFFTFYITNTTIPIIVCLSQSVIPLNNHSFISFIHSSIQVSGFKK